MVNDKCLECGLSGHFAGSAVCGKAQRTACASGSSASTLPSPKAPAVKCASFISASANTPILVATAQPAASAKPKAVASAARASAAADDLEARFDIWLSRKRLRGDDGWIPLKSVLLALGEPW